MGSHAERAASTTISPGTVLGGAYHIDEEIGRGAVGIVYRATHATLGRAFAVKVLADDASQPSDSIERFVQEARTASSIAHEHIVDVTHLGRDDASGVVFVVMELLEGEDLEARIAAHAQGGRRSWMPDAEVQSIAGQLFDAVATAHEKGVVHRDLKPSNIFLARRGEREIVKVVDFGLSKLASVERSVRLTKSGQPLGTPLYMSPEQSKDSAAADHRADIYALGVILYEMLAGVVPFPASTIYECVLAHATERVPPLGAVRRDLPLGVVRLVHRCLEKQPGDRFQSVRELAREWESAWRRTPRGSSKVASIAIAALAIVALAVWAASTQWTGVESQRPLIEAHAEGAAEPVSIRIATDPANAELVVNGARVENPYVRVLAPSPHLQRVEARLPGYVEATREVRFDGAVDLTIQLASASESLDRSDEVPRPRSPTPQRRAPPAGAPAPTADDELRAQGTRASPPSMDPAASPIVPPLPPVRDPFSVP
jgi:serine/threonine protein kinase